MRFFVISDTHGKTETAVNIYKKLEHVDMIIHLGDLASDAKLLESVLHTDVISVKGNMDGSYSKGDFNILETEYGKIYLAHGHMENVKVSPQTILYRAMEEGCKAAIFGHTHIPYYDEVQGIYLLNPGSLTLPKGGHQASYAMVNTSETTFEVGIIYVDQVLNAPQKTKPKVEAGYLKNLLNNSDRF